MLPTELVTAGNLVSSHYLVRTAVLARRPSLTDDLVRLLAWIQAEGNYHSPGSVRLCQSPTANPEYVATLDDLADRMGFPRHRRRGPQAVWPIGGDLAGLIQIAMPEKIITPNLWGRLSVNQARLFLYELARGDGNWAVGRGPVPEPPRAFWRSLRNFFVGRGPVRIFQRDRGAIDAAHAVAVIAGLPAHVRYGRDIHTLTLSSHRHRTCVGSLRRSDREAAFTWCPVTELGTWVARRAGTVVLTGNSGVYFQALDALLYFLAIKFPSHEWLKRGPGPDSPKPRAPEPRDWLGM